MEETRPILLLDFDGVIADTFSIAAGVARKVCVFVDEMAYRKRFDGNIYTTTEANLATDHGDPCDHTLDWFAEYAPLFHAHARPFPGMPEILRRLSQSYRIVVVSSTQNQFIEHFLQANDLQDHILEFLGGDVNPSKYEKFKMIFAKYGIKPNETVFVTDTLGDINEASLAEITSIGVTWGFQDRATLERGKPFRIVEKPAELPDAIEDFFAHGKGD